MMLSLRQSVVEVIQRSCSIWYYYYYYVRYIPVAFLSYPFQHDQVTDVGRRPADINVYPFIGLRSYTNY